MAANQKGEWPKICKLGSHDLISERSVVVKILPKFDEKYMNMNQLFEILQVKLSHFSYRYIKLLIFEWLTFMQIR